MTVRWATLWDIPQAINYAIKNAEKGNLDHRIYRYPTLKIMRVENGEGNAMAYLPIHTGLILESLGFAPDLDAGDKAAAAIEAVTQTEREAYSAGIREAFFVSSDERTDRFAVDHMGYERLVCLRKRF